MRAEGQRRKETTKNRMGIARVPPAMINRFTISRSAAIAASPKNIHKHVVLSA